MEKSLVESDLISDSRFPKRKILRLQHYDYSQNGLYFITICVQERLCLFGKIVEHQMLLNFAGKMIENVYLDLEKHFPAVKCLDYVIMPNHFHCIIQIENRDNKVHHSLFDIIQRFKSITTVEYIKNVKTFGWAPFNGKLWQRSYYEHIIRDDKDYLKISEYIEFNPYHWQSDQLFIE